MRTTVRFFGDPDETTTERAKTTVAGDRIKVHFNNQVHQVTTGWVCDIPDTPDGTYTLMVELNTVVEESDIFEGTAPDSGDSHETSHKSIHREASTAVVVDNTRPQIAFLTANGVSVTADRVELTWSGEAPFVVDVRGTARDDRTGVRHVEWRLDDQPYALASPVADLWDDWHFLVTLDRPGEYTLWAKPTDGADNSVEKPLALVVAPPVESAIATVLLMPPLFPEGPIQYLATFPETSPHDGTLVEIANEEHPDPIHFVKDGFTARACEEPEATLPLARGARTTPADLAAIFGTETPVFPVVFVACLPADTPPADLPAQIPIVIRYTLPRDE
jgi:hypothetical protein